MPPSPSRAPAQRWAFSFCGCCLLHFLIRYLRLDTLPRRMALPLLVPPSSWPERRSEEVPTPMLSSSSPSTFPLITCGSQPCHLPSSSGENQNTDPRQPSSPFFLLLAAPQYREWGPREAQRVAHRYPSLHPSLNDLSALSPLPRRCPLPVLKALPPPYSSSLCPRPPILLSSPLHSPSLVVTRPFITRPGWLPLPSHPRPSRSRR